MKVDLLSEGVFSVLTTGPGLAPRHVVATRSQPLSGCVPLAAGALGGCSRVGAVTWAKDGCLVDFQSLEEANEGGDKVMAREGRAGCEGSAMRRKRGPDS